MNFIKKVFNKKGDESVHRQFIRFGKGEYGKRAVLSLQKTPSLIKLKSGFEFANDFVLFIAGLVEKCNASGLVLSKRDISDVMSENRIKGNSETKKGGLYYQNNISDQELNRE